MQIWFLFLWLSLFLQFYSLGNSNILERSDLAALEEEAETKSELRLRASTETSEVQPIVFLPIEEESLKECWFSAKTLAHY